MKKTFFLTALLIATFFRPIFACTIFIANDGKNVWVGNNEDDAPNKSYKIWIKPAKRSNENGYLIWAANLPGVVKLMSSKFPEGGINEHGLFIDAAALPEKMPIKKDATKKDWKGYVISAVLKNCRTVTEATQWLAQYNLVDQEKAQLFIADASGDYAIVHANYTIKKETRNFVLTNYSLQNEEKKTCWRRDIVSQLLATKTSFGLPEISSILDKSAQKDFFNQTNYSIAADLKNGMIYLYQQNDFASAKHLSVKEALGKGKNELEMTAFRNENNQKLTTAIHYINEGNNQAAIPILEQLPQNNDTKNYLAYVQNDQIAFKNRLKNNPNNYFATLFGAQQQGKVTFSLDYFEAAKKVYLVGDFTNWKEKAIPLEFKNGSWQATVTIPKGEHHYKFIVDEMWTTDPKNPFILREGKNVNSKLVVY
jgi:predicted choloylglycine hydrolase